jgi:6-phosphofructokinase 1
MRIAVLTGGGDAAGLNAAIRAVGRRALRGGDDVVGIVDGWAGLLDGRPPMHLDDDALGSILSSGGTMLGTSRANPLASDDGVAMVAASLATHKIDALVAIGGDDTLSVANAVAAAGCRVIGIPKTIDFDLAVTEYCIGFETAVGVVAESLDRLRTTAASHHRIMVCEVMGRDAGWLAVMGSLAGGADLCAIPEFPRTVDEVADRVCRLDAIGRTSSIIVIAEGATLEGMPTDVTGPLDSFGHPQLARRAIGERLAEHLHLVTGHEVRDTVLGHVQRGGPPAAPDRIWPTRLGVEAVDALRAGATGVAACVVNGTLGLVPIGDLVAEHKRVPADLYALVEAIS